jgi:hypothetical protein
VADRPQPRPARPTDVVDLAGLDQRVAELAQADQRRQQHTQADGMPGGGSSSSDSNGTQAGDGSAQAEDPLARMASMLTGLRDDVDGMRAAFLDLPTMDELDGRMAALETRLATVEAALAATGQQVADLVTLVRTRQARQP